MPRATIIDSKGPPPEVATEKHVLSLLHDLGAGPGSVDAMTWMALCMCRAQAILGRIAEDRRQELQGDATTRERTQ